MSSVATLRNTQSISQHQQVQPPQRNANAAVTNAQLPAASNNAAEPKNSATEAAKARAVQAYEEFQTAMSNVVENIASGQEADTNSEPQGKNTKSSSKLEDAKAMATILGEKVAKQLPQLENILSKQEMTNLRQQLAETTGVVTDTQDFKSDLKTETEHKDTNKKSSLKEDGSTQSAKNKRSIRSLNDVQAQKAHKDQLAQKAENSTAKLIESANHDSKFTKTESKPKLAADAANSVETEIKGNASTVDIEVSAKYINLEQTLKNLAPELTEAESLFLSNALDGDDTKLNKLLTPQTLLQISGAVKNLEALLRKLRPPKFSKKSLERLKKALLIQSNPEELAQADDPSVNENKEKTSDRANYVHIAQIIPDDIEQKRSIIKSVYERPDAKPISEVIEENSTLRKFGVPDGTPIAVINLDVPSIESLQEEVENYLALEAEIKVINDKIPSDWENQNIELTFELYQILFNACKLRHMLGINILAQYAIHMEHKTIDMNVSLLMSTLGFSLTNITQDDLPENFKYFAKYETNSQGEVTIIPIMDIIDKLESLIKSRVVYMKNADSYDQWIDNGGPLPEFMYIYFTDKDDLFSNYPKEFDEFISFDENRILSQIGSHRFKIFKIEFALNEKINEILNYDDNQLNKTLITNLNSLVHKRLRASFVFSNLNRRVQKESFDASKKILDLLTKLQAAKSSISIKLDFFRSSEKLSSEIQIYLRLYQEFLDLKSNSQNFTEVIIKNAVDKIFNATAQEKFYLDLQKIDSQKIISMHDKYRAINIKITNFLKNSKALSSIELHKKLEILQEEQKNIFLELNSAISEIKSWKNIYDTSMLAELESVIIEKPTISTLSKIKILHYMQNSADSYEDKYKNLFRKLGQGSRTNEKDTEFGSSVTTIADGSKVLQQGHLESVKYQLKSIKVALLNKNDVLFNKEGDKSWLDVQAFAINSGLMKRHEATTHPPKILPPFLRRVDNPLQGTYEYSEKVFGSKYPYYEVTHDLSKMDDLMHNANTLDAKDFLKVSQDTLDTIHGLLLTLRYPDAPITDVLNEDAPSVANTMLAAVRALKKGYQKPYADATRSMSDFYKQLLNINHKLRPEASKDKGTEAGGFFWLKCAEYYRELTALHNKYFDEHGYPKIKATVLYPPQEEGDGAIVGVSEKDARAWAKDFGIGEKSATRCVVKLKNEDEYVVIIDSEPTEKLLLNEPAGVTALGTWPEKDVTWANFNIVNTTYNSWATFNDSMHKRHDTFLNNLLQGANHALSSYTSKNDIISSILKSLSEGLDRIVANI